MTIAYVIGEIVVRVFNLSTDVPKTYIDKDHLIKFFPNQHGHYAGVSHQWEINKYGFFGYEPPALDSLIAIIGDSFISNEMNPPECHQCKYLSLLDSAHNYFPVARSGASFIEMMELSRGLDSLRPIYKLFVVHDDDFIESVAEISRDKNMAQVSLTNGTILYPELHWLRVKRIFFSMKFLYYMYKKVQAMGLKDSYREQVEIRRTNPKNWILTDELMKYIVAHYDISDKILVFRPDTSQKMIDLARTYGFQYFVLNPSGDESWEMNADHHWSCYGQMRVAGQVNSFIREMNAHRAPTVGPR